MQSNFCGKRCPSWLPAQVRRGTTGHYELHKKGNYEPQVDRPNRDSRIGFCINPNKLREAASAFQTGKLLDVREDTEYVPTAQVGRVHRNGNKDRTTVELPSTRKQMTYTVKVGLHGIIYTARSSGDFRGYNPSKMIVGTELEACVEANRLVITRPDGKQYEPTITRRGRDQASIERREEPLP